MVKKQIFKLLKIDHLRIFHLLFKFNKMNSALKHFGALLAGQRACYTTNRLHLAKKNDMPGDMPLRYLKL